MATLTKDVQLGKAAKVYVGFNRPSGRVQDWSMTDLGGHLRSARFTQQTRSGNSTPLNSDYESGVPTLKSETVQFTSFDKSDATSNAMQKWALLLNEEMRPVIVSPGALAQGSKMAIHWMCGGNSSTNFPLADVQMFELSAMTGTYKIPGTLRSTLLAAGEHPWEGTSSSVVTATNAAGFIAGPNEVIESMKTAITPVPADRDNGTLDIPVFWRITAAQNIGHINRVRFQSFVGSAAAVVETYRNDSSVPFSVGSHGIIFVPSNVTDIGFEIRPSETLAANAPDSARASLSMTFGWLT